MAADNDKGKRGFSGLSDLASEVSGIDEPLSSELQTGEKIPLGPQAQPSSPKEPPRSDPKKKLNDSPPLLDPLWGPGFFPLFSKINKKLIFGIIGVFIVIGLANNKGEMNRKPSNNPPSSSQSHSYPQSTPAPAVQTPSATQSAGLQYTKPSVGTNNVLAVPEIRWCIREGIRIEAMRDVIDTDAGIDEFNRIVSDYNSRCKSWYRQGSRSRAERDEELYRSQIVSEAIREARQLGHSYQPSYPSVSPGVSTSSAPKKPNAQYTREVQQLLTDLGYDPGPVDGDYGRRTSGAVKAFQRDAGITQDGWIDEDLLSRLRRAKAAYKPPVVSQPKPQTQTSIQPRSSTPSSTTAASAGYFTRGSHQDDVLQVQGTPTTISSYANHEAWMFGTSSVNISLRDMRVTNWSNFGGNLKVQMIPGSNITNTPYFTRGSHQDDVLRVQGTPTAISSYANHEVWMFGISSVNISMRSRQVTDWKNISGNLMVR